MHPASLTPRGDKAGAAKIGQVPRDFWLAHPQDIHKVADANFPIGDEVKQAQAGAIGQGAKERVEREGFYFSWHETIIYGLTDMSKGA